MPARLISSEASYFGFADGHLLSVFSHHLPSAHIHVQIFFFFTKTILKIHFHLVYSLTTLSPKSHVLSYWELGHKNFGVGSQFWMTLSYSPWSLTVQACWKVRNYSWCGHMMVYSCKWTTRCVEYQNLENLCSSYFSFKVFGIKKSQWVMSLRG